jgi:hypothetical protein
MPAEMKGRRIPVQPGLDPALACREAGDYYGPIAGKANGALCVFFLLPIARDPDAHGEKRSLHHVQSPPHQLFEEADGSLTIRESIGAGHNGYYWHGFLNAGHWELNKRPTSACPS